MKIFLDTADIEEIRKGVDTGLVDGVTTNPSLAAQTNRNFDEVRQEILDVVKGPVSLEVIATDYHAMLEEGRNLARLAENVVVKLPMGVDGLKAVRTLKEEGVKTNVTLVFSANQAMLAAKAGATYVSPFIGRMHDAGHDGIGLIEEIREIFDNFSFSTFILAASDRSPLDTKNAALAGADAITIKPENFWKLYQHPFTDQGLAKFLNDWNNKNA